jgi:hypothetical protein
MRTPVPSHQKQKAKHLELKRTRRISYGATAADEGLDEHLVGQDVQLLLLLSLSHVTSRSISLNKRLLLRAT